MDDELVFFFFQAEDGIRDADVTGVQTCALPISADSRNNESAGCQTRMPLDGMPISGGAAPVTRSARWFSPASRDRRIAQRYHWAIRGRPPDASRPRAAANGGLTSSGARPYGCGIGTLSRLRRA